MDIVEINREQSTEFHKDAISTMHHCNVTDVKKLCIFDLSMKLKTPSEYDIGGCYSSDPELWFFYSTSVCPGHNYLLSLFVCNRKASNFSINISSSNQLKQRACEEARSTFFELLPDLKTYYFVSGTPDECYYIKTFCFTEKQVKALENCILLIPIEIKLDSNDIADSEFLQQIKLGHKFGHLLGSKKWSDIVVECSDREKRYDCHKSVLASQSTVLKDMINHLPPGSPLTLDIEESEASLLLEFIYTGTVQDLLQKDCLKLLDLAKKFDMKCLFDIAGYAISEQIEVKNAVSIAVISEKYSLNDLQKRVFEFIRGHPDVLDTDEWTGLDDVRLTKKMLRFMHSNQ